jgi:inner membrane protein
VIILDWLEHTIFALFVGWWIYVLLDFTLAESIVYFMCIPVGGLLPDIDMPKSKLGKKVKPISNFINKKVGHRTLTHSIFFITVLFYSSIIAFGFNIISVGLMVGCVIHIFFDMTTPSGVPLAYPFSNKRYKLH